MIKRNIKFVCYYNFTSFFHISLGLHMCLNPVNIEIHLPFGYVRIGIIFIHENINYKKNKILYNIKTFGYNSEYYTINKIKKRE
jgi:hypothetical protein